MAGFRCPFDDQGLPGLRAAARFAVHLRLRGHPPPQQLRRHPPANSLRGHAALVQDPSPTCVPPSPHARAHHRGVFSASSTQPPAVAVTTDDEPRITTICPASSSVRRTLCILRHSPLSSSIQPSSPPSFSLANSGCSASCRTHRMIPSNQVDVV